MTTSDVTELLRQIGEGRTEAYNELFPHIYAELRRRAHAHRQRWHGNETLNTTALVHEAYLKLVDQKHQDWENRVHFVCVAAQAMRHILIDYARGQQALKRGGDQPDLSVEELEISLEGDVNLSGEQADILVLLDEALNRLERFSERQSRVVECRFFGDLTIAETAEALDISPATVKRDWALAQAWLYREIQRLGGSSNRE